MILSNKLERWIQNHRLPTFAYQNLSRSADDAFGLKTFAQTIEKKLPGGKKEIQVIGKGSKIFRDLFGEINDVRHSIFEGMNRIICSC